MTCCGKCISKYAALDYENSNQCVDPKCACHRPVAAAHTCPPDGGGESGCAPCDEHDRKPAAPPASEFWKYVEETAERVAADPMWQRPVPRRYCHAGSRIHVCACVDPPHICGKDEKCINRAATPASDQPPTAPPSATDILEAHYRRISQQDEPEAQYEKPAARPVAAERDWPTCDECRKPARFLHIASGINKCHAHVSGGPNSKEWPGWVDRLVHFSAAPPERRQHYRHDPLTNTSGWYECQNGPGCRISQHRGDQPPTVPLCARCGREGKYQAGPVGRFVHAEADTNRDHDFRLHDQPPTAPRRMSQWECPSCGDVLSQGSGCAHGGHVEVWYVERSAYDALAASYAILDEKWHALRADFDALAAKLAQAERGRNSLEQKLQLWEYGDENVAARKEIARLTGELAVMSDLRLIDINTIKALNAENAALREELELVRADLASAPRPGSCCDCVPALREVVEAAKDYIETKDGDDGMANVQAEKRLRDALAAIAAKEGKK